MASTFEPDRVTLEISPADLSRLNFTLGIALKAITDYTLFCDTIELVNRINTGNPHFAQYVIPPRHTLQE